MVVDTWLLAKGDERTRPVVVPTINTLHGANTVGLALAGRF